MEAEPGDVITVNPNELHDGLPIDGASRSWHMLFIAPETMENVLGRTMNGRELTRPVARDRRLLCSVMNAHARSSDGAVAEAEEALASLLDQAFNAGTHHEAPAGPSRPVQRILDRIHDAPNNPITLLEAARIAGMSRTGALRRFQREVGAAPNAYAMQLRVRRTRALLLRGLSLTDAALACGFADQSHMTRAFKRQFGVPPGRYRTAFETHS